MNAFLNYPGSKWGMAKRIIDLFPQHRSYVEPFFGSGAALFNKPPSAIETVNDLDGDIVNFFEVLRREPERLVREIAMTPYARDVFDDAHRDPGVTPFERAVRFCIRSRMGHGFKTHQKTGFKIDVYGRERSYCVDCWNKTPELLLQAAMRLKEVQIENRPAIEVIKKFNHPNVLIYADPPYLPGTRCGKMYKCEMTEQDHVELLGALREHTGYVVLSGYASELYDRELAGWSRIEKRAYSQSHARRTEVLWCNFEVGGQMQIEDEEMM